MKYVITLGLIMLGVGVVILFASMAFTGFSTEAISITSPYEKKTTTVEASDKDINIDSIAGIVEINRSPDSNIYLTYFENETETYEIIEGDSTLEITQLIDKDKLFFDNIFNFDFDFDFGFGFDYNRQSAFLEILIPENYSADIYVQSSACDITLSEITADDIDLQLTNGAIKAENVSANKINAELTNGDVNIDDVTLETLRIISVNAAINAIGIDANDIELESVNGIISGEIDGDESEYSITSSVTLGANNLPASTNGTTDKTLMVKTINGSIDIDIAS